jgi:hypothetical protein
MGRHSAPDDESDAQAVPAPTPAGGAHADLQMLRENPALRARCIAGALVPFILYTVGLIAVGRADIYLVWVWIPIVVAGILVGAFLDLGYRSARAHRDATPD